MYLVCDITLTNRAPRSASTAARTALRAPRAAAAGRRSARRGLGSPVELRLKPAKTPPIFEHDPRAARAGAQRL